MSREYMQQAISGIIDEVRENNKQPERYISELYNTMMYINQLFGQEMERWLLEHHYKVEGQG